MKKILCTTILFGSLVGFSQENDNGQPFKQGEELNNGWKLTLGANYRSLGNIKAEKLQISGGGFINGSVTDDSFGQFLYKVSDPLTQVGGGAALNLVRLTSASVSGSGDIDSGVGVILKAGKELSQGEQWSWSFDWSLTTVNSDTSTGFNAETVDTIFNLGDNWNELPDGNGNLPTFYVPGVPAEGKNDAISGEYSPEVQDGSLVNFNVNYDLDLGVYTLGAGMSGHYELGKLDLFIGAGPTLSVIDYDASYSIITDNFSESQSSDGLRLRPGLYAEVGVAFLLSENWGIGVSGRYDWIPGNIETEIAEIELSGFSGTVFLSYQF